MAMAAPAVPVAALAACAPLFCVRTPGRRRRPGRTRHGGRAVVERPPVPRRMARAARAARRAGRDRRALRRPGASSDDGVPALRRQAPVAQARRGGASELRIRPIPLRNGQLLAKGETANIDEFDQAALRVYRTLVLRRSPAESRPPSDYRLVSSGRWYDIWQRDAAARPVLEHLPLGEAEQPAAVPECSEVARLARVRGRAIWLLSSGAPRSSCPPPARPRTSRSTCRWAGRTKSGWAGRFATGSGRPWTASRSRTCATTSTIRASSRRSG